MQKSTFLVTFLLLMANLSSISAINYNIAFTGTGASTSVDSVIVQNLTKGTSVTVLAGKFLNLNDAFSALNELKATNENIRLYPNLVNGQFTMSFYAIYTGTTQINVFSLDGRKIVDTNQNLQEGVNSFQISLPPGSYLIRVTGNGYAYSAKMIVYAETQKKPEITYNGSEKLTTTGPQKSKSIDPGTITMNYSVGDQLLYKGFSGNFCTIVTDKPVSSNTTNFNFIECKDGDGNYYPVVKIGSQIWMAENLKTTKFNDGTAIPIVTDNTTWRALSGPGYCWYNFDATTYKNTYGALYKWETVNTTKLAPIGWHVPTKDEWDNLVNYLIVSGYNYDGTTTGNKCAKSLASTDKWNNEYTGIGKIGSDLSKNNSSGFSALPGGDHDELSSEWIGQNGTWWSSTVIYYFGMTAWYSMSLSSGNASVGVLQNPAGDGNSIRCVRDLVKSLPAISTITPSTITYTTAASGGNITSDGNAAIVERGLCWSTSPNPTTALNTKTSDGSGIGTYRSFMYGLTANTVYYIRSYATNSVGTAYGEQISISTRSLDALTVNDIDGNTYHTVTIGTQVWLKENLATSRLNDGTAIPYITDNSVWSNMTTPGFCWYDNDENGNNMIYGGLYNWYAVNTGKLAPPGWHISTKAEWSTLVDYLRANGFTNDGTTSSTEYAKALAATTKWAINDVADYVGTIGDNLLKNNSSGFSALPGGYRNQYDGLFGAITSYGYWWCSDEVDTKNAFKTELRNYYRYMLWGNSQKNSGFSIRCIKDAK